MKRVLTVFLFFTFIFDGLSSERSASGPLSQIVVTRWSNALGETLRLMFEEAVEEAKIKSLYDMDTETTLDPQQKLEMAKKEIEKYLEVRTNANWFAKLSLEARTIREVTDELNDKMSPNFTRFVSAKTLSDEVLFPGIIALAREAVTVNATKVLQLTPNANLYGIPADATSSVVHIPTSIHDRTPALLADIDWSDIYNVYQANKDGIKDLAFQMFCSVKGFFRYYPATSWKWDSMDGKLDLFDCRNTDWYMNAATMSKNVIIMLDVSGSMSGQHYEVARFTIETVLDTLSDNDFFSVLRFSRQPVFLGDCAGDGRPLPATLRNKKMVLGKLSRISPEGRASYEDASNATFMAMMNISRDRLENSLGCNDAIMLITDGVPSNMEEIFNADNFDKTIRFFSFLIGEESTPSYMLDMACNNNGFMVHIKNLADVQEKVQQALDVFLRPVGKLASDITREQGFWSAAYRERLLTIRQSTALQHLRTRQLDNRTELLAITLGYPVALDGLLMGVAGVMTPVTELQQLANMHNPSARGYMFMLNNNGYAIFHPQLRPTDQETGKLKSNYNSVDISELEVLQGPEMLETNTVDCENRARAEILLATENLRRVYRQTNNYYISCINNGTMKLGFAAAEDELKVLEPNVAYSEIKQSWVDGDNWRIHPHWRYCMVNDSDSSLTAEQAFRVYVNQTIQFRKLPPLCENRKPLVDRLLFHMNRTKNLWELWNTSFTKHNRPIDLVFFATTSGMIRFWDRNVNVTRNVTENVAGKVTNNATDIVVNKAVSSGKVSGRRKWQPSNSTSARIRRLHFLKDLNNRSVDDEYFIRSTHLKHRIVYDIRSKSSREFDSLVYARDNSSTLVVATRALYKSNEGALLGVAGIEFLWNYLNETMRNQTACGLGVIEGTKKPRRLWCYLLDEHGYIVYSSKNRSDSSDLDGVDKTELGNWFGNVNGLTERAMSALIEKKFYSSVTYVDYQATCTSDEITPVSAVSFRPALTVMKAFLWLLYRIWKLLREFATFKFIETLTVTSVNAYTSILRERQDGFSCDKYSKFYLANFNETGGNGPALDTTGMQKCDCDIQMYASWISNTNLLLVVIAENELDAAPCSVDNCKRSEPPLNPFGFKQVENWCNSTANCPNAIFDNLMDPVRQCRHTDSSKRILPTTCIAADLNETGYPCSMSSRVFLSSTVYLMTAVLVASLSR